MKNNENVVLADPPANTFRIRARDVTGLNEYEATDVVRGTPAGAVAQAIAARMELPGDLAWSLRSDRSGTWLRDELAIDQQVDEAESLTITPRAHLGAGQG